jgi:hypothetical protein
LLDPLAAGRPAQISGAAGLSSDFQAAKRYGWTPQLDARFWRVWHRLVAIARARAAGDVDMDEISRLMGWD